MSTEPISNPEAQRCAVKVALLGVTTGALVMTAAGPPEIQIPGANGLSLLVRHTVGGWAGERRAVATTEGPRRIGTRFVI